MTISWLDRSSGMIFEIIISAVRSPGLGRIPPAGGAAAVAPFTADPSLATWKISPNFCAMSRAEVFFTPTIHTRSPLPGWSICFRIAIMRVMFEARSVTISAPCGA